MPTGSTLLIAALLCLGVLLVVAWRIGRQRTRGPTGDAASAEAAAGTAANELREALAALQQARDQTARAQDERRRLLAAAARQLAPPLRDAQRFAVALQAAGDDPVATRQLAARIDDSLSQGRALLDSLGAMAELEDGSLVAQVEPLDAAELCRALIARFAASAELRGLSLSLRAPPCWVRSDRVVLQRILHLLLDNALRYTAYGGALLALRRRRGEVRVQVWDTGPGFPLAQQAGAFDAFQQGATASPWAEPEQGLGLGLAICQRSAALLGHRIGLRSRLGRGSVFEIVLPRCPAPPARAPLPDTDVLPAAGELDILCVDADAEHLTRLTALLRRWGQRPRSASSPEAALVAVREASPALLLVDLQPEAGLDGFALISILRREAGAPLSAALLCVEPDAAVRARAAESHLPLLDKPVHAAALRALVAAVAAS